MMIALLLSALAGIGAYLLIFPPRERSAIPSFKKMIRLSDIRKVSTPEVLIPSALIVVVSFLGTYLLFGSFLPSLLVAIGSIALPFSIKNSRRNKILNSASDKWPSLLNELKLRVGAGGESIPQALFSLEKSIPPIMVPAFKAANKEWLLTTDFPKTISVLKNGLKDPTADIVCETLLVAYEIGGNNVDVQLESLITDLELDLRARKDARSKQAGARFARRFVLFVPIGMTLAGLSIGSGRTAYETVPGQLLVSLAIGCIAVCWWWAGRIMQIPRTQRIFTQ